MIDLVNYSPWRLVCGVREAGGGPFIILMPCKKYQYVESERDHWQPLLRGDKKFKLFKTFKRLETVSIYSVTKSLSFEALRHK